MSGINFYYSRKDLNNDTISDLFHTLPVNATYASEPTVDTQKFLTSSTQRGVP